MGSFNKVRDVVETAATLGGNYLLPGSSLLTSHLVSKGSQDQLGSTIGKLAQIGTGLTGSGFGTGTTGIPAAADIGAGWTNFGNGVGGAFGNPTLGSDIAGGIQGIGSKIGNGISDAASSVGRATGLSDLLRGSGAASDIGGTTGFNGINDAASVDMQAPSKVGASFLNSSGLASPALSAGTGGGSSIFGGNGLSLGAALLGGANTMDANEKAKKALLEAQTNSLNTLQPYLASGGAANSRLSDLLGTSGNSGASGYGSLSTPFTAADLQNDPGYQFQLAQGNKALDRQQAAKGNYFSGSALKAAQDYGQGLADTTFANAFARDQAQKQQQYGMFAGQAGAGQNAANTATDIYGNVGNARAGADISSSNIINQTLSSLLTGSGAKRLVGYTQSGQPLYA